MWAMVRQMLLPEMKRLVLYATMECGTGRVRRLSGRSWLGEGGRNGRRRKPSWMTRQKRLMKQDRDCASAEARRLQACWGMGGMVRLIDRKKRGKARFCRLCELWRLALDRHKLGDRLITSLACT
jgi:hypothetical protein